MDKATQKLMTELEELADEAEKLTDWPSKDDELPDRISIAFRLSRALTQIETRRKKLNEKAQATIKIHTGWFKPMENRLGALKKTIREGVAEFLMPDGELGNMDPDEVKAYGVDGLGTAIAVEDPTFEVDVPALAKSNPELVKVDTSALKKLAQAGKLPKAVKPKMKYSLRIQ